MGLLRRTRLWWQAFRGGHLVYVSGEWSVSVKCLRWGADGEPRKVIVPGWGSHFVHCPVCGRHVGIPKRRYKWVRETGEQQ